MWNIFWILCFLITSVKPVKITGSNIVVFFYVNNNTQYIVNYNAKCFASFILIHLNWKKNYYLNYFSQIFKAVASHNTKDTKNINIWRYKYIHNGYYNMRGIIHLFSATY